METKFTPGPWSCEIPDIGDPLAEDERGNNYWEIAPIHQRFENNEYICVTGWMSEANAHLIAAAPELLEALQKAVNRQGFSNYELISARAAIAKATGQ